MPANLREPREITRQSRASSQGSYEPKDLTSVKHLTSLKDAGYKKADYANTSFPPVFAAEEYEGRWERLRHKMVEQGIDTLLVACPANIHYLTGFDGWGFYFPQYIIIVAEPKTPDEYHPVIIARHMDAAAGAFSTYLPLNRTFGYADSYVDSTNQDKFASQLAAQLIAANGWACGKLGLDMNSDYFTAKCYTEFCKFLGEAHVVDDNRIVNWVRLIKSKAEIQKIREAAKIMDKTFATAYEMADDGCRTCDLAADIMRSQVQGTKEYGGTFSAIPPILGIGKDTDAGHMQWSDNLLVQRDDQGYLPRTQIGEGSCVAMELGASRNHYHCPMARTIFLGKPSDEYLKFVNCCYRAMDNMVAVARPGKTCSQLFEVFNNTLQEEGYSKSSRVGYSFGIGYPPDWGEKTCSVRPGDNTVLEPGMALHLIAGCGDRWVFETSEAIVITEGAAEQLHGVDRKLWVKPLPSCAQSLLDKVVQRPWKGPHIQPMMSASKL